MIAFCYMYTTEVFVKRTHTVTKIGGYLIVFHRECRIIRGPEYLEEIR